MTENNELNTAGFRIKSGMTTVKSGRSTSSLSPSGLTGGSIMAQSGRSMVEMLGTLVIIGVLSIGGIAGYSYGMDKYRANETINDVNLRGIDLVAQVAMGRTTLSLSEWPTVSKAGYDISEPVLSVEGDAYFTFSGVPKRVCEMVYDGIMQNQTTDVEVNGYLVDDSSACRDDNIMGFFFITNAGEGGTNPEELCKDVVCPEGSSCTHGICMSEEVPQFNSNGGKYSCKGNNECAECEYCDSYGVCTELSNNTPCPNDIGKICWNGHCIEDKTCIDNSECDYGYYCGTPNDGGGDLTVKKCIKAEFYKLTLHTGEDIYVSKQYYTRPLEDAKAMCESVHFEFINNYEDRGDVVGRLKGIIDNATYFNSETQTCSIAPDYSNTTIGHLSCYPRDGYGFIVCVKENKVYEGDIVWAEPETTTGG